MTANGRGAEQTIFHLKNGDRLTGAIASEDAKEVTIDSPVAGKVVLPLSQIERREKVTLTESKPAPPAPASPATQPKPSGTNDTAVTKAPVAAKPPPPSTFKQFLSEWNGDAQIGVDLGFATKTHQTFTARLKAVYTPFKTLRNNLEYLASYGTTDGILSDNQMDGSWKIEYDLGKARRFLVYNAIGAGYNEIQKIDLRYDLGPGMGYKLIVRTNLVWKAELGGNFQQQYFSTGEAKSRYSLRLAEDVTWQITSRFKFDHKLEFFPELQSPSDYRIRGEGNLSYLLRTNLTLNLSVIDQYDTAPAAGASNNDLQIRSLLGVKF